MKIFISAASSEFRSCRDAIASDLRAAGATVHVQEDFANKPGTLLQLLENYIAECDRVILLIGSAYGTEPVTAEVPQGSPRRSYTQWEYFFAVGERLDGSHTASKALFLYFASSKFDPDTPAQQDQEFANLQIAHRDHIIATGHVSSEFTSIDNLGRLVLRDGFQLKSVTYKPNNLPFATLGSLFKGREETLAEIQALFENHTGSAVAIHGLGGIGKTRIAAEYAHANHDRFSAILYVGADSPESIDTNTAGLCSSNVLDLPQQSETDAKIQFDAVKRWLRTNTDWLLIFDNADTEEAAQAVQRVTVELGRSGNILITSRLSNWPVQINSLRIDELSVDDAVDYLLSATASQRRETEGDEADATTLANVLGCLPLALSHAAAYIRRHTITFAQYLSRLEERREAVLRWYKPRLMDYPTSVAATWETSFHQLTDDAKQLLQILSWFAPDPIPVSITEIDIPEVKGALGISSSTLEESLAELAGYSLVTHDHTSPLFTVHLLVQDVTRSGMPEEKRSRALERALNWLSEAFSDDPEDVRTWPTTTPLLPHAISICKTQGDDSWSTTVAKLLNRCGQLFTYRADYLQAEPLIRRALEIRELCCGPNHPDIACSLTDLARLLADTNKFVEAEPLLRRALEINEASFGTDSPEAAESLNDLAYLLKDTDRRADAENMLRRSLEIKEACFGPSHPQVATGLNNLASVLKAANRPDEAEPLFRRALGIDEKAYGPSHPDVARDLSNLAGLLRVAKRYDESETMYRRALTIYVAAYGENHPNVSTCLNNLAVLLTDTKQFDEAEAKLLRALAIAEAHYGPDHDLLAFRLSNLARLYASTNRQTDAEPRYERALRIFVDCLGAEHPHSIKVMEGLVKLRSEINNIGD